MKAGAIASAPRLTLPQPWTASVTPHAARISSHDSGSSASYSGLSAGKSSLVLAPVPSMIPPFWRLAAASGVRFRARAVADRFPSPHHIVEVVPVFHPQSGTDHV